MVRATSRTLPPEQPGMDIKTPYINVPTDSSLLSLQNDAFFLFTKKVIAVVWIRAFFLVDDTHP